MDRHYNNFYNFDDEPKIKNNVRYKEIITDNTVLIHFVGVTKPWFEWAQEYPAVKYFKDIYEASMWRDKPLFEASTLKQLKKNQYTKSILASVLIAIKLTYAIPGVNGQKINITYALANVASPAHRLVACHYLHFFCK